MVNSYPKLLRQVCDWLISLNFLPLLKLPNYLSVLGAENDYRQYLNPLKFDLSPIYIIGYIIGYILEIFIIQQFRYILCSPPAEAMNNGGNNNDSTDNLNSNHMGVGNSAEAMVRYTRLPEISVKERQATETAQDR